MKSSFSSILLFTAALIKVLLRYSAPSRFVCPLPACFPPFWPPIAALQAAIKIKHYCMFVFNSSVLRLLHHASYYLRLVLSTQPAVQAFSPGTRVFSSRKRHPETRKERRKWGESKGAGQGTGSEKSIFSPLPLPLSFFRLSTYPKGYYFYSP